ncbi:MAG: hypothetical protein LIO94_13145 [Clostridiales bacterium]|nr:hypothetical protein [Clostridiales bacterium]
MHKNSGVRQKGTFAGLKHKAAYLKSLGVNQVKLMPVYEFPEVSLPSAPSGSPLTQQEAAAHALDALPREQVIQKNFWGYGKGFYFAPKASYAFSDRPDVEFKDMIREFHVNGIEVILEFAFDESADIGMICECLNYWADEYHVDGFSLVGRDNLAGELARLPLFSTRKLICGWYPSERSDGNTGGKAQLLARSDDGFMNDARRLLKGDTGLLEAFAWRTRLNPSGYAQINYVTNHDGFTLMDLVSYNEKHNEANDEMGRDGSDSNFSWNCGKEGPSSKRLISQLRMRQRKNAYAMLLLSQGIPMLLAGDEFGNSQLGNNNPWCHDSELTWLDWSRSKSARELTGFVQQLISYRKGHPVLHQKAEPQCSDYLSSGYPDLSYHGERAWFGDLNSSHLHFGCMYSGSYVGEVGFLYIAWNFHWEEQQFALPILPESYSWFRVMDTFQTESFTPSGQQENLGTRRSFSVTPRTVVLLEGRKDESVKTLKKSYEKSQNDLAKSKRTSENHHGA